MSHRQARRPVAGTHLPVYRLPHEVPPSPQPGRNMLVEVKQPGRSRQAWLRQCCCCSSWLHGVCLVSEPAEVAADVHSVNYAAGVRWCQRYAKHGGRHPDQVSPASCQRIVRPGRERNTSRPATTHQCPKPGRFGSNVLRSYLLTQAHDGVVLSGCTQRPRKTRTDQLTVILHQAAPSGSLAS